MAHMWSEVFKNSQGIAPPRSQEPKGVSGESQGHVETVKMYKSLELLFSLFHLNIFEDKYTTRVS
jgi:hypothetical protein